MAALMGLSGCSAAGVVPAGADALLQNSEDGGARPQEESSVQQGYDASLALLWVINEEYSLPRNYEPAQLEELGGAQLASPAAEAFWDLQRGMDLDGAGRLVILEGYRSREDQENKLRQRMDDYLSQGCDAVKAETFARYDCGSVGCDPAQTGLLIRVRAEEGSLEQEGGQWLSARAADYGFQAVLEGETAVLRYVGELHAAAMRQLNVDFDGYIAYLDAYRQCLFTYDGAVYKAELVLDLSLLGPDTMSVCGDNRGGYIALSAQEEADGYSGG